MKIEDLKVIFKQINETFTSFNVEVPMIVDSVPTEFQKTESCIEYFKYMYFSQRCLMEDFWYGGAYFEIAPDKYLRVIFSGYGGI